MFPKKNPTARGQDLGAPAADTPTVTSTTPDGVPLGGVAETRKALSNEVASFIFGAGQKKSALRNFSENAPLSYFRLAVSGN